MVCYQAFAQTTYYQIGGWEGAIGISLYCDSIAIPFLALVALLMVPLILLVQKEKWGFHWRFYIVFFLVIAAFNGIILTSDLFNLFVFIEIMSLSGYILCAQSRRPRSLEAGVKYLIQGTIAGMFLLLGITILFISTQTLNYALLPDAITQTDSSIINAAFGIMLAGLLLKIGVAPFHFWRPDAYQTSHTTICALMSGIMTKAYIYVCIRLADQFFFITDNSIFGIITIIGCLTIVVGHTLAYVQDNLKRLLAYSTIAQLGYILIGIGANSTIGTWAAIYHALSHSFMKVGLFFIGGVMIEKTGTEKIFQMNGLGKGCKESGVIFTALAMAIVGLPPFNGFVSKILISVSVFQNDSFMPVLIIGLGTLISATYYLKIFSQIFNDTTAPMHFARDSALAAKLALILAFVCLITGLIPLFKL